MDTVTVENNKLAPEFTLPDLDGQAHNLADYRGVIVVINFWSAECQWAERADKEILVMLKDWGGKVVMLSIASNANEPAEMLKEAATARAIPLVLHDADQRIARLYDAQFTPQIFVLDGAGITHYQGAFDDVTFRQPEATRNYLREAVEALLDEKEPPVDQAPPYGCTVVYYRPD
ncbi:MAG: redoxin domain-containing protein [Chloroflexi bacterium]|nr:redoxin domain-containing protein [Chloroflexota bacterium]